MSLIPCTNKCVYQDQGYCMLDNVTQLSQIPTNGCAYFQSTEQPIEKNPTEELQSFQN